MDTTALTSALTKALARYSEAQNIDRWKRLPGDNVDVVIDHELSRDIETLLAVQGVGARMRAGLRASNRRARHLPMRYETGLPSSVIRFRT